MSTASTVFHRLTYGIFAKAPVTYTSASSAYQGFGGGSSNGPLDSMGSVSTLYSIVNLTSTTTAQVDWRLFRKTRDGRRTYGPDQDNRTEILPGQHPALNLLDNPNPAMTRNELIERTQQSIDLVGESFWVVQLVGTVPIELWPVRADKMTETLDEGGNLVGWYYREPNGDRTWFPDNALAKEVIHIQTPDPGNVFRGISPVRSLMVDLESVKAAGRFNLAFFKNSARPGGYITADHELTDRELDRLTSQWREQHQGVNNAHRVGLLENNLKWVEASTTMADMQFAELRNLSRDLIREAYRIHKHMLGQSDDVNRANAVAASQDYATWQLIPRLERIEQALNGQLLPLFGDIGKNVIFCYDDPVPMNLEEEVAERDSKIKAAILLIDRGADWDETLTAFGLPQISRTEAPVAAPSAIPAQTPSDMQVAALMNRLYTRKELA